jgi:hypothetical protein
MSASGHKRTWRLQFAMSALHSIADIRILFEQLIGALLEKWGHVETERFGSF